VGQLAEGDPTLVDRKHAQAWSTTGPGCTSWSWSWPTSVDGYWFCGGTSVSQSLKPEGLFSVRIRLVPGLF